MARPKSPAPQRKRAFAAIRKRLGWSVGWASLMLGCSVGHLRALENSRKPLAYEFARKMARVYDVSLDDLLHAPPELADQGNRAGGGVGTSSGPARRATHAL
jgi:transcriptional regulator with XRE-family HTH domain